MRPRIPVPQLGAAARYHRAMEKARRAVLAAAELMPHHSGPNAEFTRFMVNLNAELRRGGYLLAGDGKGGFLPAALPTAAELAERRDITRRPEGARDITARPAYEPVAGPGMIRAMTEQEAGEAANEERRELAIAPRRRTESEHCRVCGTPIASAELCERCGEGNDPFQSCDNSGKDHGRI